MARQLPLILVAVALLGIAPLLSGQNEHGAELVILGTNTLVEVEMNIQKPRKQLFVPYCEERRSGEKYLCTGAARLEVETRHGWQSVKLRTDDAVLGGFNPKGGAPGKLIPPGGGTTFIFAFSKELFAVEHGQRLRVMVEAWPDEESMKAGDPSIQLASPPFKCP
jgi:hypothetical protein